MKKHSLRIVALVLLVCFCIVSFNFSGIKAASAYQVTLDGKALNISVVSKNGTLYFQLDTLLKSTGWSGKITKYKYTNSQFVEMTKGDDYSSFFNDYDSISVYCKSSAKIYKTWGTKLDKKMFISNNNLYVPLKFVKDILRLDVTTSSNKITLKTMRDHTLLVYMIASDLESNIGPGNPEGAATADLKEMMKVGSTSRVNVVVQTGGTSKWNNNIIKGTSVKRWYVQKGGMKLVSDIGEKNMGDPKDLETFIEWGMSNYPAESYTLLLWDHGGGPLFGYGYDELNKDKLTMKELKTSLGNAYKVTKKKFTTIGFDACLMNSLEIADMLSPYASFMIASQVPLPAHGFDYSNMVNLLEKDTDPLYPMFGTRLVDEYQDYTKKYGTEDDIQLSNINLDNVKKFMTEFNKFFTMLNKDLEADPELAYELAIARADNFNNRDEDVAGDGNDLTNLSTLLWRIGKIDNGKYSSDIEKLRNLLYPCIREEWRGKNVISLDGMSIYMPLTQFADPSYVKDYLSLYKDIGFSSAYTSLVERYYKDIMLNDCKINITKNVTPGTYDYYYKVSEAMDIAVSKDSLNKIKEVTSVVEKYNKDLGKNVVRATFPSFFDIFREDTEIKENSRLFTLNGNDVTMLYAGRIADNLELFTVPVLLNDAQANLYVIKEGYNTYYIGGVQVAQQENESGMSSKRSIKLESSDTIEPVFLTRDSSGQVKMERSQNQFSLNNGKIEEVYPGDVKDKFEFYFHIELFNNTIVETEHARLDSSNN